MSDFSAKQTALTSGSIEQWSIITGNTLAEVTQTGYLSQKSQGLGITYQNESWAAVRTTDNGTLFMQIVVSSDGLVASLVNPYQNGTTPIFDNIIMSGNILDPNLNIMLGLSSLSSSAVNYVLISNTGTGTNPTIRAAGSDSVLSLDLRAKSTGSIDLLGGAANVAKFYNISNINENMVFDISALTSSRIIAWPDASGTVSVSSGSFVDGDFAIYSGTSGQLIDSGFSPSNAAKTKVVMAEGASIANHIATYSDINGTISLDSSTAINVGDIQAGNSGNPGTLISYPSNPGAGKLVLSAANSGGNVTTTITHGPMSQSTTLLFADPGAGVGLFGVMANSVPVDNGTVLFDGVNGLLKNAPYSFLSNTTTPWGGGATFFTFTATGMTSSSIVGGVTILSSTNPVSIASPIIPGPNTLTVTFSADPGANTVVSYIATTQSIP